MKKAATIAEIPNAFSSRPLVRENMDEFYYEGTMPVRTGDAYGSPIRIIYEGCEAPGERNSYLLLGHHGCGKSTELNRMREHLEDNDYRVRTIQCASDLDLMNPGYADLLILMGEALLDIAEELHIRADASAAETIREFWIDVEVEKTKTNEIGADLEAGIKARRTLLKLPLISLFANAKGDLKYNDVTRKIYREQIRKRISNWIKAMDTIADQIAEKLDDKQPVIIFEDLDKLGPAEAWKVFYMNSEKLTGVRFPVIYTFPIALSYDPKFHSLEGYFDVEIFPMMKLTDIHDQTYQAGIDAVWKIVEKRAELSLFEDAALDLMIRKTGGSLRDLFYAIIKAAKRARWRKSAIVAVEDANRALLEQQSLMTRRIERRNYGFLADIYRGHRKNIEEQPMLLEMLDAGVVLEYNGERWHNLHPLIAQYLEEQNLTNEPYSFKTGAVNNGGAGVAGEPEAGSYG